MTGSLDVTKVEGLGLGQRSPPLLRGGRRAEVILNVGGTMDRELFIGRREALQGAVGGALMLIPGATNHPLNIPMNYARFRQSSHVLYLCGLQQPGVALLGDGASGRWELFMPTPPPGDEIWHGKVTQPEEVAEAIGADAVYDIGALEERVEALRQGRPLFSLPAPDQGWLSRMRAMGVDNPALNGDLGRDVPNPLADAMIALRMCKDEREIHAMHAVSALTSRVHRAVMGATKPGVTEAQLRALVEGTLGAALPGGIH